MVLADARQAQALQGLAQVVIDSRPRGEILQAAAAALHRVFGAPAVVFVEEGGAFTVAATAGDPKITPAEEEAAKGSLTAHLATRSETYPFDQSEFDFWSVTTRDGSGCVVGVDFTRSDEGRPKAPEQWVDVVRGYLAAAFVGR